MKKLAFLLVFSILISLVSPVYAGNTSITATYDAESGKVTISGNANGETTIVVRKDGVPASMLSDGNLPVDADQITVNGTYTHNFYLPQSAEYGKYHISVTDTSGSGEDSIIYYDKAVADGILRNNISNNNFVNDVKSSAEALGIDTTLPSYSDDTLVLMSKIYTSYIDSADFNNKYNYCVAICSMKGKGQTDVEAMLQKYEAVLKIDYNKDYKNNAGLSSQEKSILCSLLSKMDYAASYKSAMSVTGETEGFVAVFKAFCALSAVSSAESWEALKRIYTEEFTYLNSNVVGANTNYKTLSSTDVFTELKKLTFNNISDLKDNFENACTTVKNKPSGSLGNTTKPSSPSTRVPASTFGGGFDELPPQSAVGGTQAQTSTPAIAFVPKLDNLGNVTFPDVSSADWFSPAVLTLASSEIINGDANGIFRPYDSITRAEFAKIITSAFSFTGGTNIDFSDVSDDAWYASYVQRAAAAGIISGYNGNFNPDANISKQDAAVMLYRVAGMLAIKYSDVKRPLDYSEASLYAWTAISSFYGSGIIKGDNDGYFKPLSSITRAEAAQLIFGFINDLNLKFS